MTVLVVELDVPGLFDDADFTERTLIGNGLRSLFNAPRVIGWNWTSQHQ